MTAPADLTMSNRGFKHFGPIPSRHGGSIRAYESSNADGPHIWLNTKCPVNLNNPEGEEMDATAHLALEDATTLRDQLTDLIDNHYQMVWDETDRKELIGRCQKAIDARAATNGGLGLIVVTRVNCPHCGTDELPELAGEIERADGYPLQCAECEEVSTFEGWGHA